MKMTQTRAEDPFVGLIGWDLRPREERAEIALDWGIEAALIAKKYVPFYRAHYKRLSDADIRNCRSAAELSLLLPELTKDHLSANSIHAFLPEDIAPQDRDHGYFLNKGTGGTSGRSVTIIYSRMQWRALCQNVARSIWFGYRERPSGLAGLVAMGIYNKNHATNELYRQALEFLDVRFFDRVSTLPDATENYELLQQVKPNVLLGPPEGMGSSDRKGITLDRLFDLDARNASPSAWRLNHSHNPQFEMLLWSSAPLGQAMADYLIGHLSIPVVQGQYGATEFGVVGTTCMKHPLDFHLAEGHSIVTVKPFGGNHDAGEGEEGYVVASKVCGAAEDGSLVRPSGTIVLNFRTGDAARIRNKAGHRCECGRDSPLLGGLRRIENRDSKLAYGCQVS